MSAEVAKLEPLSGWGNATKSWCEARAGDASGLQKTIQNKIEQPANTQGVCMRGMGRGYGDCATNGGGIVYRLQTEESGAFCVDAGRNSMIVPAGALLKDVVAAAAKSKMVVPVVPGTQQVSLGGMVAADIHGKNHHRAGSIGNWIHEITYIDGRGELRSARPGEEAFLAIVGGMGLVGAIVSVEIGLQTTMGPYITQKSGQADTFSGVVDALRQADEHEFSVAWVDLLDKKGRGSVLSGNWAEAGGWEKWKPSRSRLKTPKMPHNLINAASVAAFNAAWWARERRRHGERLVPMEQFFHPLDGIDLWNRVYGRRGFVQYQFVVGEERLDVVEVVVHDLIKRRIGTPMVVLKRFGDHNGAHLSFPRRGWTLAVDIPAGVENLAHILWRYDDWVAEAGGAVYLAKDSCLQPTHLASMYPNLPRWQKIKKELDPQGVFQSDLGRRLGLC